MNTAITRRHFFRTGSAVIAAAALTPPLLAADSAAASKRTHKKAIMWGTVGVKGSVLEKMKAVKAAGFDGAEMNSHMDQGEVLKARDETGLEITSVCGAHHWSKPLSHPDAKVRAEGLAALKQTLRDAKAYGAGSILLVPGVVNKDVTFEQCWSRSIEQIRLALPLAEELGVTISIENVWNNFITDEDQAVRYLNEINNPRVQWHFDVGNIIRYGDPIAWIKALNQHITRVHVKEYSRDRAMRTGDVWKGFNAPLLEGANNWSGIMKALDEVGFREYLITEQGGGDSPEGLRDLCARLEKIIAS
ncbi:MAG TPA: sugar phosphate isomerase/epimerase family protein [Verrucomicrobiae bacterium]|nr:sugar phosphate isomerase/epimerase family protein [Verrucomicrobiae bacterium]